MSELVEFLRELDLPLIIELPSLFDMQDGGKSLLHKCTHLKSNEMMEKLIEVYRESYMQLLTERRGTLANAFEVNEKT